jgi:hypothetical protein
MTEPRRWRDDHSTPDDVRELLLRAKGAGRSRPLPPASRARSVARLDRMLAIPAAAGILLWLKGVAVAAGIGVLGVVAVKTLPALISGDDAATGASPATTAPMTAMPRGPRTRPTMVPAPVVTAPEAPTVPALPSASAPLGATSRVAVPQAPSVPAAAESAMAPEADSLASEAAMLDRARLLLGSDPAAALRALDAYTAAFPTGHLGLERELLAVDALRRMGHVDDARARGQSLLARARGSIYEDRVRAILDALPAP